MKSSSSSRRVRAVVLDVDNTLYPRSSGLGPAMGDRMVAWVRRNVNFDVSRADERLPSADELHVEQRFHHPPDISRLDDVVERMCLQYYRTYGLTLTGLRLHHGVTDEQEKDYLRDVHYCSEEIEKYMPHRHEHEKTAAFVRALRKKVPVFLFSNAHDDHVVRILEHLGMSLADFDGCIEYWALREHCKPSAEAYRIMMKKIKSVLGEGISDEEILFFDDSPPNLKTAKQAGWKTVLVGTVLDKPADSYVDFFIDDVRSLDSMWKIMEECGISKD
jgi:pyrimidine 5'-nucleotidase